MTKKSKKLHCPRCGAEVSREDEFCLECGKLLLSDENYDAISDEMDEEDEEDV